MKSKTIILFLVVAIIVVAILYLEKSKPLATSKSDSNLNSNLNTPELTGITGYINTGQGLQLAQLRGKVVLVDFWTYTCINCIRTLPHLIEWDAKYRDKGLVIIGVHTPEFEFEKKTENVREAVQRFGIKYPVVQDNNYATWQAFSNRYWPHKYLIDKDGKIRYDHVGEGNYDVTEAKIRELLAEIDSQVLKENMSVLPDTTPNLPLTPELYLGYQFALPRGQNVGNDGGLQPGVVTYNLPQDRQENIVYLQGVWHSNPEYLQTIEDQASLFLRFRAAAVHLVGSAETPVKIKVSIDGHPISEDQAGKDVQFINGVPTVIMQEPRLYELVKGPYGNYELTLVAEKGLRINSFTFG